MAGSIRKMAKKYGVSELLKFCMPEKSGQTGETNIFFYAEGLAQFLKNNPGKKCDLLVSNHLNGGELTDCGLSDSHVTLENANGIQEIIRSLLEPNGVCLMLTTGDSSASWITPADIFSVCTDVVQRLSCGDYDGAFHQEADWKDGITRSVYGLLMKQLPPEVQAKNDTDKWAYVEADNFKVLQNFFAGIAQKANVLSNLQVVRFDYDYHSSPRSCTTIMCHTS